MKRIILFLAIIIASASQIVRGQDVAVKTNLLSDAFFNPNLGIEIELTSKWTLDVTGQLNVWTLSHDKRWKHWLVQPETRYWFCEAMSGHFLGLHALAGQYNIGHIDTDFKFLGTDFSNLKSHRYQGWFGGLGVAYGYSWLLGKHWNLEAELGIGWTYTRFDQFECEGCGRRTDKGHHNYIGPTKAAINLIYVF